MATASGRNLILALKADVAALRDNSAATAHHLEQMGRHVERLATLSGDFTKRLERLRRRWARRSPGKASVR